MEAGKLNQRVIIQSVTYSRNDYGEAVANWSTSDTRWARVEPLSGRELYSARQLNAEVDLKVTLRYKSDLTARNRLLFGTRILEIGAVTHTEEAGTETIAFCTESPDAG
jgi:SPP1 family predicted phage head-tail adaptor